MKLTIIAVGKLKERYLKEGIAEYAKRLSRFCELELIEVDDEQAPEGMSPSQVLQIKKKEAEKIQKKLRNGTTLVILDIGGDMLDSEGLASKLSSFFVSGISHITFVIGGSLGIDSELLKAAQLKLSLSRMTFPHQLTRLILLEQLYRAFKINGGETYHK